MPGSGVPSRSGLNTIQFLMENGMAITAAWHGKTLDEHVKLRDSAAKDGFRFLSLSIHGTSAAPHYTAVMIKRPVVVAQRDWPLLTNAEFQKVFNEQAKQGFGPVMVAATGTAADPRFAIVFQIQSSIALTRFGLRSGAITDPESIQGMNLKARADNLICTRWRCTASPMVFPSAMSDAQPLVPMGYGDEHFERQEGGGGLSAATTDLARLIAIMQSPNDTPALRRSTIEMMINNGIKTAAAWIGPKDTTRTGHGWDTVRTLGNHKFYGQKGGFWTRPAMCCNLTATGAMRCAGAARPSRRGAGIRITRQ